MQGVVYPAANVLFSVQTEDPAALERPPSRDPAMATDPLVSVFGGWQAIENSALALTEAANLLLVPGRVCSNGVAAPIKDPTWSMFVEEASRRRLESLFGGQSEGSRQDDRALRPNKRRVRPLPSEMATQSRGEPL
jgi:hypothetical protein